MAIRKPCSVYGYVQPPNNPYIQCKQLYNISPDQVRRISSDRRAIPRAWTCDDLADCSIDKLGDVSTSGHQTPLNGQVLQWSSTNSRWQPSFRFLCSDLSTCSISSLSDVNTAALPTSGDLLTWNSMTGNWENKQFDCSALTTCPISSLSDVDTSNTTPADGQLLVWNNTGSIWERGQFDCSALTTCPISSLSDVDTSNTTPADGQLLVWNNTGSIWERETTFTIDQLEQTLTDIQDKNAEQDTRLDALEAAPSLPTATQANEYLYYDGTDWVVGGEVVNIGRGAGVNTVGATYLDNSVFIGKNAGRASVGTNFYQNTVCVGLDLATNNQTLTRDSVAIGRSINNIRPFSIGIGSYMEKVDEAAVAIGRFSTNASLNDRKVIGINSIAIGRSRFDIPRKTIYLDANNTTTQTGSPDLGSIGLIAELSEFKMSGTNITVDSQASGEYFLKTDNGVDYTPQEITFAPSGLVSFRSPANTFLTVPRLTSGNIFNLMTFLWSPTIPPALTVGRFIDVDPAPLWQITPTGNLKYVGPLTRKCMITVSCALGKDTNVECDLDIDILQNGSKINVRKGQHISISQSPVGSDGTTLSYFTQRSTITTNDEFTIQVSYLDGDPTEILHFYSIDLDIWSK